MIDILWAMANVLGTGQGQESQSSVRQGALGEKYVDGNTGTSAALSFNNHQKASTTEEAENYQ